MRETGRHLEAFEYYYRLGSDRTYEAVARQFNGSHRTVNRWGKEFNWQERVRLRELEDSKKAAEKSSKEVVNVKAKQLKEVRGIIEDVETELGYIRQAVSNSKEALQAGDIKAGNPRDLDYLAKALGGLRKIKMDAMKHELLLHGEADSRSEQNFVFISRIPRPQKKNDNDA